MAAYTVLLRYPDYISDNNETYLFYTHADSPAQAQQIAQLEVAESNAEPYEQVEANDFLVLAVFKGFLTNLKDV